MAQKKQSLGAGIGIGVIASLLGLLLAALITAYSGAYNIAATEDHTPLVRWMFETTLRNSVKSRAADIEVPAQFTESMMAAGAGEYKSMCQHCHGGPGVEPDKWSEGMLPQPPHLTEAASEWRPQEIFWLVKHGVKMAGMPAFGPTHSDETLWNITAFVQALPGMTGQEYAAYGGEHTHGH